MKRYFHYDNYSKTMRLFPENYLIAHRRYTDHGDWIPDMDIVVQEDIAVTVFKMLRVYEIRYERFGTTLADKLNEIFRPKPLPIKWF